MFTCILNLQLRKKANKRKEQEPDFEDKKMNLSVDEEREFNKENDRQNPFFEEQVYVVFNSPDPKGHVSYCYHWVSVVRLSLAFCILINSSKTTGPI